MKLVPTALATIAALTLLTTAGSAAWKIESLKDQMSDKTVAYATLAADAPSQGILASLHLVCVPKIGVVPVSVLVTSRLTRGVVPISFRIDDGELEQRSSSLDSPNSFQIMGFNADFLKGHKRFRLQIFIYGATPLFYNFNIGGVDEALSRLKCRRPP